MEKNNSEKRDSVLQQCSAILTKLNEAGFCHGDSRSPNILVRANGVSLVDPKFLIELFLQAYYVMDHEDRTMVLAGLTFSLGIISC